ncbi:hypothetical protein ABZY42_34300 [Streptomyces sp. NPDC006622]|uniref:hypothetical protein n=1 Tax=Streptomyces sp. NPDC006622 TaxID=3155459 RepID=UPI0033B9C6AC
MNAETEVFIRIYLNLEQAHDIRGHLRPTLYAFRDSYVARVREGLSAILVSRELSPGDYESLTDVEFVTEDDLYAYLGKLYAYLFEDARQQPLPPE